MVEYAFYQKEYGGAVLTERDFDDYAARAADELARYRRLYRVAGDDDALARAVCAMTEALWRFDEAEEQGRSVSVGAVKCGAGAVPCAADRARELKRSCERYLDIYRGAGGKA